MSWCKKYICKICGTEFDWRTTRGTHVCSQKCYRELLSKMRTGEGNPRFNNGWRQYINVKKDVVNCEMCGCDKKLETHHKDSNKRNNNIDNLIKVCRKCHMTLDGRFKNLDYHNSGTGLCSPGKVI